MRRLSPRTLLSCFKLIRDRGLDVFQPEIAPSLAKIPGWHALELPVGGIENEPCLSLLDALRALALQSAPNPGFGLSEVSLVATLPRRDRTVLATEDVVTSLVNQAQRSILVVGYDIRANVFRQALVAKALKGIAITVVGDRETRSARELKRDWPAEAKQLRALENVEPANVRPAKLHGKALVVDEERALIGSANFTTGGLRDNLEVGLRIQGPVARELTGLIERLTREGWLVPAPA